MSVNILPRVTTWQRSTASRTCDSFTNALIVANHTSLTSASSLMIIQLCKWLCLFVCDSVCMFFSTYVCLSVCLSICDYDYAIMQNCKWLSVTHSFTASQNVCFCRSVFIWLCNYANDTVRLSVRLSVCVCLCVHCTYSLCVQSVCLSCPAVRPPLQSSWIADVICSPPSDLLHRVTDRGQQISWRLILWGPYNAMMACITLFYGSVLIIERQRSIQNYTVSPQKIIIISALCSNMEHLRLTR